MAQCGAEHSVCLDSNGSLWVFGSNESGQLGIPNCLGCKIPHQLQGIPEMISVSCGKKFTACVDSGGHVWTFGSNSKGQLGIGNYSPTKSVHKVEGMSPIQSVHCGSSHLFCLGEDSNKIYCFGNNASGQLGLDSKDKSIATPRLASISNIKMIACGKSHTIALSLSRDIYIAGSNEFGQLGCGTFHNKEILKFVKLNLENVSFIACGNRHSLFLNCDGELCAIGVCSCFGSHVFRNPLPIRINLPPIQKISCGETHSICVDTEGSVWTFGDDYRLAGNNNNISHQNIPVVASELKNIVSLSQGGNHSILKCSDGKILVIGNNNKGQLGIGSDVEKISSYTPIGNEYLDILPQPFIPIKSARK